MTCQIVLIKPSLVCTQMILIKIFSAARHVAQLTKNLDHDLDKLNEWLIRNKLHHHPTKTKVIYMGSRHNHRIGKEQKAHSFDLFDAAATRRNARALTAAMLLARSSQPDQ